MVLQPKPNSCSLNVNFVVIVRIIPVVHKMVKLFVSDKLLRFPTTVGGSYVM